MNSMNDLSAPRQTYITKLMDTHSLSPATSPAPSSAPSPVSNPAYSPSLYMMIGAMIVFGASLLTSAYFFSGFLGDGRSWVGVFQAFLLCFGLGGLLFLPALILFFMARHVRIYGVKLRIGIAALLISFPLWLGGGSALALRLPHTLLALTLLALGLGVFTWGFVVFRTARTRK